jgi:hypothetical protein
MTAGKIGDANTSVHLALPFNSLKGVEMKRWMASVGVYLKRFYLLEHVYAKHSDLFEWRNREMLSAVRVTRECKRTHGTNESERHVTINWLKKVAENVYG